MTNENKIQPLSCKTTLSFQPILTVLKHTLEHGSTTGAKKLYSGIIRYAEDNPVLLRPIEDLSSLEPHKEWLEMLLSILFPPTTSEQESLYCVGIPFSFQTIYTSRLFHKLFIEEGTMTIRIHDNATGQH